MAVPRWLQVVTYPNSYVFFFSYSFNRGTSDFVIVLWVSTTCVHYLSLAQVEGHPPVLGPAVHGLKYNIIGLKTAM